MDGSAENLDDEAEAEEERPLSVLWEKCIQQSIIVDLSDNDSLHLSDLQPGSFTICLNQDSPASDASLNISENSELDSSTEVDEEATESSVTTATSGESETGSSGIRHSGTHVSQPAGQTPVNLKEKRLWRYEDDPANTSDEDQEDLPYDGDLLASQCVLSAPRGETSKKQEKTVHNSECKNTDLKAATDLNSLCALSLKGETGRGVAKLPNPQAAAAAVTAVAPSKDADAAPCTGGEEQAAHQGLPEEAAATSKQPQHGRAGTAISDLLLRHFTREELQNATELIDAETLPEVSLMESLDDTVVSLVSQHILRHGPTDCGHSAGGKRGSQCEAEEEVEEAEAEAESGDDRTVLSERVGETSVNSQRVPGTQRQPSQEEEQCSAHSQSSSSSPQPAKEEDSPQRPPLVRTRSFSDLKYGQGQVHYRLPDFSKVAPKVKIPKTPSGGSRSVCPSPGIQRVQSSPSVLAKSSASHVATMALISRVLEDIIQPNDRDFLFREQEWDQGPSPQLQVEYDNLVAINTEADKLVDRMVQGDNIKVVSEPSLNTCGTDKKEVKGVRRDSCEMRAIEQSIQAPLTGPDKDFAKAPEPTTAPPLDKTKEQSEGDKMTHELMEIVCQFGQKVAEFKNGVSAMCTSVEEQQMVFKGMMDAQDQLERNYMAKKEEHRALERQNYMGFAKNTGEFDPDRQVEGEIFKIGMLLEDVKEQIDANACQSFSSPLSTSTPVPPPHHHHHQHQHRHSPQPPLPEDRMTGFSMSDDGRLEEEEGSGGQTQTGYMVDLTGDDSISLQYSDTSLEGRETTHASTAAGTTADEEDEEEERPHAPAEDGEDHIPVLASPVSSETKDRLWDTGSPGWRHPVKTVCTFSGRPLGGALSSSNEGARDPLDHGLCSVQKTRSPEIDSGLGSSDRSRSTSGQSQPQSHTERLQLLSGPGSPLTTSGSDSEVSTSRLQTTVAMATSATLLRPQPLRITAGDQWLRGGQQDRSITRQDQEGGAFSPEQLSPFSREGRPSSFSRVPSRVSTHSLPPSETQPHSCTCHSEALLALQCEVAHLRRALEERLSHLPQPSSRPKQERRSRTRPKPQHRPSSSRGTKSNPGALKVDDWISSDMDRSKSKDSRSSELSESLQKSLSSTSGFLSPQRKSQISSPTVSGDRQWSPDLPLSSSTRDDSLRQDHCPSYLPPDEGGKDVYARNRELALSRQPLSRPSLQLNYDSSCSLPASFKVLEGQSSSSPYQRRRSTQSDSALLPSNGYLLRSSLSSPRQRGSRTKHRTSKEEDISRTLDKAIEAARSMKRTTERMAQSLSADLAKAELQRKLNGLHASLPSEKRPNADS